MYPEIAEYIPMGRNWGCGMYAEIAIYIPMGRNRGYGMYTAKIIIHTDGKKP